MKRSWRSFHRFRGKWCLNKFRIEEQRMKQFLIWSFYFMMGVSVQAGLIGYWDFENIKDGVVRDISGNCKNGIIHGSPEIVDGRFGKALRFKTNEDYVDFREAIIPENDFTISVWLNCDDIEHQFFLGQYKYKAVGRLDLAVRNGAIRIQIDKIIDSTKLIVANEWNHLAFSRKDKLVRIYLNGEIVTEKENNVKVIGSEPLILGKLFVPNRNDFNFAGVIDELKIWNSALSEQEVKTEFKKSTQAK